MTISILIVVGATLYFCVAFFHFIASGIMDPIGGFFGLKRTPGWLQLLQAFGWPVYMIISICESIATRIVAFFKWLK